MRTVYVSLTTEHAVQDFVERLAGLAGHFDLMEGSYILDAHSLMGIFSLDLTKPLRLDIERDTPEALKAVEPFLVAAPPNLTKENTADGK